MSSKKAEFIYWFAYYNLDSPSVRYRGKYSLEFFRKHKNIKSYFVIPRYSLLGFSEFLRAYLSALFFRKRNSLIVIQRVQSTFIYSTLLKLLVSARNRDTVYDLDDADYLEVDPKTIYYFAKHCQNISAGSKQIEKHLRRFNDRIVLTTSPTVDLNIFKIKRNSIFTIGWVGAFVGAHKESMIEIVFPALKALSFQCKIIIMGVVKQEDFEFISKYFERNLNIEIEMLLKIDWNDEETIQKSIVRFDIGIATLTNSETQLSKSGIKAKQYLNNGVPVLSTNLPENSTVVIDGVNGFFCDSANDFKERLNQFYIMSDADYMIFSKKARESIHLFDHNNFYEKFQEFIGGK